MTDNLLPQLPPCLEEAEFLLAFRARIQSELLKLARAFLTDEEINRSNDISVSDANAASSLDELIEKYMSRGLKIDRLEKAGHVDVSREVCLAFLESLLRPFAVEVARLGFREAPRQLDGENAEDSTEVRRLRVKAEQVGFGIFNGDIDIWPPGAELAELAGGQDLLSARENSQRALDEAIALLREHGPDNKKWRHRLDQFEKTGGKLVQEAFVPSDRDTGELFERVRETVRAAFKLLGKEPNKEPDKDLIYAYVGKLTALAGLSLPRSDDSSHSGRVRKAIERRARENKSTRS